MVVYFLSLLFVSSFPPFLEKKIVCGVCLVCGLADVLEENTKRKGKKNSNFQLEFLAGFIRVMLGEF
jgi:hypothetical protein